MKTEQLKQKNLGIEYKEGKIFTPEQCRARVNYAMDNAKLKITLERGGKATIIQVTPRRGAVILKDDIGIFKDTILCFSNGLARQIGFFGQIYEDLYKEYVQKS